jgi:Skp family chaperone for outer membrane proteins
MKIKAMVWSILIGVVVLFAGYEHNQAEAKSEKSVWKVGVVSVRKTFQDCRRNARYREESTAEQDRIIAELEKLSREIEAERAGLKALKPDSSDYRKRVKEILEKQANLQAQQEFHKQEMELKDQRWTEELYEDILQKTGEAAKQKGLDLVLEKDELDFPAPSANELMLAIRTYKLLYCGGCLDITKEVLTKLDADESGRKKTKSSE